MHYGTEAPCLAAELSVRHACTVRSAYRHGPCGPAEQTVRGLRTNRAERPNNLCGALEQVVSNIPENSETILSAGASMTFNAKS